MRYYRFLMLFLPFVFKISDVGAACDLSGFMFSSYRKMQIMQIVIQDGAEEAGVTIEGGDSAPVSDQYNMTIGWKNAGSGDINSLGLSPGSRVYFSSEMSYFTGGSGSCQMTMLPNDDLTDIILSDTDTQYQHYFQRQFHFGGILKISPGCEVGTYSGSIVFTAQIFDPQVCPEGGTVRSTFPAEVNIQEVKGGATLSVYSVRDLNFGSLISPNNSVGTVKIDSNSDTPEYNNINSAGGASPHRGEFQIKAVNGTQYNVEINYNNPQMTLRNNSGDTLEVTNMNPTKIENKTIDYSGIDTHYIGGTLNVRPEAKAGDYEGTYTIQVNY